MKHYQTEGIILRISDHGEADKLVTFFSPDLGKATGIAKGAKRSKKRFTNKLELFTRLQFMFNRGRISNLLFLSEAELIDSFLSLRQNYARYVIGVQLCELTIRFNQEYDRDPRLYHLLLWALDSLDMGQGPLQTSVLFQLKLLSATGYQPNLERCTECDDEIPSTRQFAPHPANGSLLCEKCLDRIREKPGKHSSAVLSFQTLQFLRKAQGLEIQKLDRLQIPEKAVKEALFYLHQYTRNLLQQDIHCWSQVQAL